ncbi:unnamed protein product [Rotaria socialis]|uniref:SEC7 domain-containing protein n=1 Tax=Rotaria socialis TaxID=392032 RepID=A0A818P6W2_9BILA|nr:unnamed protein product [Rotaria socialis]CAF4117570.1 unnamed protein product [Rotaria socialis]CAF4257882.1 unnamed protein product [Rotaria socialis]CAF4475969.1 unnamed protein product [Rotaria socialis]
MEQYLRQRIDCPPPGGTRTLIEEKDSIIKKQQDDLNKLQAQLKSIQAERDYLLSLLSDEQKLNIHNSINNDNNNNLFQQPMKKLTNLLDTRSSSTSTSSSSSSPSSRSSSSSTTIATTCPINAYELSQDLQDKQIEMLEKKYGGSLRCRRAATRIQRAYRQYKLQQNFRHLCATMKTNKRLSCTFVDTNNTYNHKNQSIKPLKPCLRTKTTNASASLPIHTEDLLNSSTSSSSSSSNTPTNSDSISLSFTDRHLDLPSINFEHFIETTKQQNKNRKRVCIVTDMPPNKNFYDPMDSISDFVDGHSNKPLVIIEANENNNNPINSNGYNGLLKTQSLSPTTNNSSYYKNLTDSPMYPRKNSSSKPPPPVRSLSLKPHSNLNQIPNSKTSPIWKRKTSLTINTPDNESYDLFLESPIRSIIPRFSPTSTTSSDRDNMSLQSTSSGSNSCSLSNSLDLHHPQTLLIQHQPVLHGQERTSTIKMNEAYRRRCYRAGLNIFNKKSERGIRYLISHRFLEASPHAVARFLLSRKGLSRQMIGEYLGNLQDPFAMQVLHAYVNEFDFHDMPIDIALRKFQSGFRLPGEAQKIEQLMQMFGQRYCITNPSTSPSNIDTIFILAFAIIMLNTDLHSRNIKPEKKMRQEQFIKNLRAIDYGEDLDIDYLTGIYERIRAEEFRPDNDHVTQVAKFEQTLIGKKPSLVAPHRRLVCYCRLYEIYDLSKRERLTAHQREVFLFNDLLVITKISGKKRQQLQYQFRQAFRLSGMNLYLFETTHYQYGIRLVRKPDIHQTNLITFNARNEHDRTKFCEDLKEAIMEMDEMEGLRIQTELDKLRGSWSSLADSLNNNANGIISSLIDYPTNKRDRPLSRTLSNSLLDMTLTMPAPSLFNHQTTTNNTKELLPCRNSQCSVDSGMVSLMNEFSPTNGCNMPLTTTTK